MKRSGYFFKVVLVACVILLMMLPPSTQAQSRPGWPRTVTIGSGSVGGVFYLVGGGYARLLTEKLGVTVTNRTTRGASQNIELMQGKEIDLGMTTAGPAFEALRGIGWARTKMDAFRVAIPMYPSYAHWVVNADSPIRTISDLSERVVDLQTRGGTSDFLGQRIFPVLDVKPRRVVNLGVTEGTSALRDRVTDAIFTVIGVPLPAWAELALTRPVRFFGFTREHTDTLLTRFPYLVRSTIRSGVYRGQDDVISTASMWTVTIVHKDLPEDLVYELVKLVFENHDFLVTVHPSMRDALPVNIFYARLPLHPGAVRYFREQGTRLTDEQIPPEMR